MSQSDVLIAEASALLRRSRDLLKEFEMLASLRLKHVTWKVSN